MTAAVTLRANSSEIDGDDQREREQRLEGQHREVAALPHAVGERGEQDRERDAERRRLAARAGRDADEVREREHAGEPDRELEAERALAGRRAAAALRGSRRRARASGSSQAGTRVSASRSSRAAASGSSASVIARTTTIRVAPRSITSCTLVASSPPIANHGLPTVLAAWPT